MTTQLQAAREGVITEPCRRAAEHEGSEPEALRAAIAAGRVVLPWNPRHAPADPRAIGEGTRVKVNVNLGTSPDASDLGEELEKLTLALRLGTDAVMDLSIGGDLDAIRAEILRACPVPVGTVPAYEAFDAARARGGDFLALEPDDLFDAIRRHGEAGVDFITVHAGLCRRSLAALDRDPRVLGITSRGGSLTARWMRHRNSENPLHERFDDLLDLAAAYDMTLSLGDALRPGCCDDATDRAQVAELTVLGELVDRARARGVQVMVEGPGHIPLHQVAANVQIEKTLCKGAPFYVLGPVVCDIAPGYDHVTAAIGGALAALNGADFLCYVTPAEHLRLPTLEDVRQGLVATRVAGFAADLARGHGPTVRRNSEMARARRRLDWEAMYRLSLDGDRGRELHAASAPVSDPDACSMCGDFCAIKLSE